MIITTLFICKFVLSIGILFALFRLFKGPRLMDRILSLDAISVCIIGILVVGSVQYKSPFYIDLILVFSLLNFIGTVAYVFYLNKSYEVFKPKEPTETQDIKSARSQIKTKL